MSRASFGEFVAQAKAAGQLVVQPRMGFSDPILMRAGLQAVRDARAITVGTITLDSYTRVGEHALAAKAVADDVPLNGFPIVTHGSGVTGRVVDGIDIPVQVRHGSADPRRIFTALVEAGLHATEGGPVSYCLPYSRMPLRDSVGNWVQACEQLRGHDPHLETFGGCMMGQLCPPSLLVALSLLEGMFFRQHGIGSISLSYAQQTHAAQDAEAVRALRTLAGQHLSDTDWHVVLYAYMGVYPKTPHGALRLLGEAAELATRTGCARLIVKTTAEGHRIPTIAENVTALEHAAAAAKPGPHHTEDTGILAEARTLVDAVRELDSDIGRALCLAFERGLLDVPYCLHPDNAGRAQGYVAPDGRLAWGSVGGMPVADLVPRGPMTARTLLTSLSYVERRFDRQPERNTTMLPELRDHLTSPVTRTTLKVQHTAIAAAREYLSAAGFVELLPPVIGPVTDPGVRGSKQVDVDFYGHRYKLMTSAILYKQASLLGFDKIFLIAPNVRLEPLETCNTNRHLAEFHQLDVEIGGASREDAMRVLEDLVRHVVRRVVQRMPKELEEIGRDADAFRELLDAPFGRIKHASAVADLQAIGHGQSADAEIDWEGEQILSTKASRPFFVTDYPKGSRGFYDRESAAEPGVLRNFDLIAPEGFGELCSGSEREFEYARIIARMRETGENPAKYGWYLKLLREGIPGSAGFGVGIQRLVRYLTGLDAVWQASAFPKIPGVVSP